MYFVVMYERMVAYCTASDQMVSWSGANQMPINGMRTIAVSVMPTNVQGVSIG
jgi:low affinity Fe/Cu permease